MKNQLNHRFSSLKQKISQLKKENPKFKEVYREYERISDELWTMENSSEISVSDDFLEVLNTQSTLLEKEVDGFLEIDTIK